MFHRRAPSASCTLTAGLLIASLLLVGCGRAEPVGSASNSTTTTLAGPSASGSTASTATTQPEPQPSSYVIQPGDSIGGIASAFGLGADELAAYNNLQNPDRIAAGQQLLIPPGATSTSTTPTTAAPPPPDTEAPAADADAADAGAADDGGEG